jgi:hypothetical protein
MNNGRTTGKDFFNEYVEKLNCGDTFQTYQVRDYINRRSMFENDKHMFPMDQTLTRYFRERRENKGDIALKDHAKSIYMKV